MLVTMSKVALRIRMSLFGSLREPLCRFDIVPFHPVAIVTFAGGLPGAIP